MSRLIACRCITLSTYNISASTRTSRCPLNIGRYKVRKEHLKPLYTEATRLIRQIRRFRLAHVPRKENREADRLVNLALDRAETAEPDETVRIIDRPDES